MKGKVYNKKLIALLVSLVFIASTILILFTAAMVLAYGSSGNPAEPAKTLGQGVGIEQIKRKIADYAAGCEQDFSAYDVSSYINDHNMDYEISSIGAEYVFNSASTDFISVSALSETKFVVAYRDVGNSSRGTAMIGDVSGKTITYGAKNIFEASPADNISTATLSETKFVVAYHDVGNSDYGTVRIGDVSGNTMIFGSEYVFNPAETRRISTSALSGTKFVVAYRDVGNSGYGTAIIGDVSGNTVTYGSEPVFNPAPIDFISASALSGTKFVVAYRDMGNSNYGTAIIGDVSGNTITYGGEYAFNLASTDYISVAALSDAKFVVAYRDASNFAYGTAIIGDVSGNTITYGLEYVFNYDWADEISTSALSDTRFAVAYRDGGNSNYGTTIIGVVSGKTITYGLEYVFNAVLTSYNSASALSGTKFAVAYSDGENYDYFGTAVIYKVPAPTVTSITPDSGASGEQVNITNLAGTGFSPGAEVRLTRSGQPDITATGVKVASPTKITCAFDLTGAQAGTWDVVVENTDGQSGTLAGGFAIQSAFYFAEGYTGTGFQEYLCLGNPGDTEADATITYMFPDGTTQDQGVQVPASSRTTVDVNAAVGGGKEVSAKVVADKPIVVERPMYFSYNGVWNGGHDAVGATSLSDVWYFAEGYTGSGFEEWICVLNPGDSVADLTFNFQTQEAGLIQRSGYSVPAHSRGSFKVNDVLGPGYQTSLKLQSNQPVVAERSIYFDYSGTGGWHWQGGHCVMGTPSLSKQYYFAEGTTRSGFEEWVTLQNPGTTEVDVNATYQLGPGQGDPVDRTYNLAAGTRQTVFVPTEVGTDKDVSIHLSSSSNFLAERPMYFSYSYPGLAAQGGHCVIGATSTADQWFFAEGYTGPSFNEWICLQNAGTEEANVQITYLTQEAGALPTIDLTIPAGTRLTLMVNDHAGADYQLSCDISSNRPIVCERPMYFVCGGCPGGHDVVGYVP